MRTKDVLQGILTEYDESVSSDMNVDPLGMQVIWSSYGQKIFRNRISSISNDVRNFTLNLFNHAVVKGLVEDDAVVLGKKLADQEAYARQGKNATAFKQACLIYLENLYTYSMVAAEDNPARGLATGGVLGISKARREWQKREKNPELKFSHQAEAHVLVRQNSLGVSGRYKTPLVEMKFFDSNYDYHSPEYRAQWEKAQVELFGASLELRSLKKMAHAHLAALIASAQAVPKVKHDEVKKELRSTFVKAFLSPKAVGMYARDFWLSVTELNRGAAGALYDVLQQEWLPSGERKKPPGPAEIFVTASRKSSLAPADRERLEHVSLLEPLLGELDMLMNVMLSGQSQTLDEVLAKWTQLGRNASTLPDIAARIVSNPAMRREASGTASSRLDALVKLASTKQAREQVLQLLDYHGKVMEARQQSPWIRLLGGKQLKTDVRVRPLPDESELPGARWVHQYYLPQFRVLLSGLRGELHEVA